MGGFLSSNISMIICEVSEKKDVTPEFLRKGAFSPAITPDGLRLGWTGLNDLLDTENFEFALVDGRYCGFSFRLDEKRPSQPVIRLQIAEKIREEERAGGKVGAKRKRGIREEITAAVLAQTEFAPVLIDCLWDMQKGRLLVATVSEKRLERILEYFKATFGMEAWPIVPEKDMSQVFADIQAAGGLEVDNFFLEPVGSASLSSSPASDEKSSIAVENSSESVQEAITKGLSIRKMTFFVRENGTDNQYKFSLDENLHVSGLRLPKYEQDDGMTGLFVIHAEECGQLAEIVQTISSEKE